MIILLTILVTVMMFDDNGENSEDGDDGGDAEGDRHSTDDDEPILFATKHLFKHVA